MASENKLCFITALMFATTACKIAVPITPSFPDDPVPGGGANPTYYTHSMQLTLDGENLDLLQSLAVTHPGSIHVKSDETSQILQLQINLDIQADNHQALADQYASDLSTSSKMNNVNAVINYPSRECVETKNPDGTLASVSGVCVRDLDIRFPKNSPIGLEISALQNLIVQGIQTPSLLIHVADSETVQVSQTTGSLTLVDGGVHSKVAIQAIDASASGASVTANLQSVAQLQLSAIKGPISLNVQNSTNSAVSLDDQPITQFPFTRP